MACLEYLLENGADVAADGYLSLLYAIQNGHEAVAEILRGHGVDA